MSDSKQLVAALKTTLRQRGLTYSDVAQALSLSEASIKRLLSKGGGLSLERLERICQLLGIGFLELARAAQSHREFITELTPEQEKQLVADHGLLLVTMLAINGWRIKEMMQDFDFTEPQLIKYLIQLERMKMIELLPDNRIRRLVARNFSWRKGGPVQRFFETFVRSEFFDSQFDQAGEHLRLANGMLSRDSIHRLHGKIDQLVKELDTLARQDADLPIEERFGTSMVLAIRPWELSLFTQFRRVPFKRF